MLYRGLERVGSAELGIYDDEPYCPIHDDGEADEERGPCYEACVTDSVWLTDDASASVLY